MYYTMNSNNTSLVIGKFGLHLKHPTDKKVSLFVINNS